MARTPREHALSRAWALLLALAGCACSARSLAVRALGDAMARSDAAYGRDDDPALVRDAMPFALKTTESLLEASPTHAGLLEAAASGFTQYAYAYVLQDADREEEHDLARSRVSRARARRLFLRARGYGFRRLALDFPAFRDHLARDPDTLLAGARPRDVPSLYWTALAWAGALSAAPDDPELLADQRLIEAMMRRALAIDEGFREGAIHDVFIAWEGRRSVVGSTDAARRHLERSVALSNGRRAAPFVLYAETVAVARQDRVEFARLLARALAIDADRSDALRLENLVMQERARWLGDRADALFVE